MENLIEAFLESKRLRDPKTEEVLGRVTKMDCRSSCGGKLQEVRICVQPNKPIPTHRNQRIQKKWIKRWRDEMKYSFGMMRMMNMMSKPDYKCTECVKIEGFYSAVGRNFINVQPMPRPLI